MSDISMPAMGAWLSMAMPDMSVGGAAGVAGAGVF
jgi:hypothetical protein